jgi:hypothetical protein
MRSKKVEWPGTLFTYHSDYRRLTWVWGLILFALLYGFGFHSLHASYSDVLTQLGEGLGLR